MRYVIKLTRRAHLRKLNPDWVARPEQTTPARRPIQLHPSKLQFNARSAYEMKELLDSRGLGGLAGYADSGQMSKSEIKADLIANIPAIAKLFHTWNGSNLKTAQLTAAGFAIAHACYRQLAQDVVSLQEFLRPERHQLNLRAEEDDFPLWGH